MTKKRKNDIRLLLFLVAILIVYNLVIFQFVLPAEKKQESPQIIKNRIPQEQTQVIDNTPPELEEIPDNEETGSDDVEEDISPEEEAPQQDEEQNTDLPPNVPTTLDPVPPSDDSDAPEAEPVKGRTVIFNTGIGGIT